MAIVHAENITISNNLFNYGSMSTGFNLAGLKTKV